MRCKACNSIQSNYYPKIDEYYCTECWGISKQNLRSLENDKYTLTDLYDAFGLGDDNARQDPSRLS